MNSVSMQTSLASLQLPSPVLTASGCSGAGKELSAFFDLADIGAVVTKSIMTRPRSGRATPRMAETPSGMLNSIGLQGPGIDSFLAEDLPWLKKQGARAVVSIAGGHTDEFVSLAKRLYNYPVDLIEVNISCPNVESRGQVFACDQFAAARVISAVRRAAHPKVPIFAKLSPDVTDIGVIARAVAEAGADGISLINTLLGMVIDVDTMRPALGGVTGGLSGPAIRPVAVRCVWQVHRAVPHLPLLGMGGITSGADALQFILAGASAVSVGTAVFHDPSAPIRIAAELQAELAARGFRSLTEAIGFAHLPADQQQEFFARRAFESLTPTSSTGSPNTASPNTASPNTASPNTASPNTASPNTASPNTASPNTASPNTASPNTASPNTASPNTASPNTASPNTASPNTASPNTALPNTALPNTALPNTALPNTALPNTALPNTALPNTALPNTALPNAADAASSSSPDDAQLNASLAQPS